MAKLLIGVVVEVLFNRPLTIQVFPISSPGGVSNSALYTLTWRKMRRKITREPSFSAMEYMPRSSYSDESWIPMPDCFCPNGWEVVVKVVDKTSDIMGDSTIKQDLISNNHCTDRGHLCKDYFPIIGATLEDLSKDDEWTKGEQVNAVYSVTEDKTYVVECCYGSPIPDPYQFSKIISPNKLLQDPKHTEHDQVVKEKTKEFMGKSDEHVAMLLKSPLEDSKKQLPDCVKPFGDNGGLDDVLASERAEKRVRGSRSFSSKDFQVQFPSSEEADIYKRIQIAIENNKGLFTISGFRGIAFRNHHHWIKEAGIAILGVSAAAGYSSPSVIAKAACAIAFIATLTAFWLPRKSEKIIRILKKFGAIACLAGVLLTIGKDIPLEYIWVATLAFLVSAAVAIILKHLLEIICDESMRQQLFLVQVCSA